MTGNGPARFLVSVVAVLAAAIGRTEEEGGVDIFQLLKEMQVAGPTVAAIGQLFRARETIENAAARQAILKVCAAGLIRMNRVEEYRLRLRPELDDAEAFERPFYGLCPACHGTGKESIPCGKCAGTGRCPAKNCVGGRIPVSGFSRSRVPSGRTLGGANEDGGFRKCLVCNGTGQCPDCLGSGRLERPCARCAGTGKVWNSAPAVSLFERSVEDALRLLPSSLPPPAPRETPASASESPSPRETAPTPDAGASPSVPDSRVWAYAGLIILIAMGVGGLRLIRVTHR